MSVQLVEIPLPPTNLTLLFVADGLTFTEVSASSIKSKLTETVADVTLVSVTCPFASIVSDKS